MESESVANVAQPFEGVVLCCTSIPVDLRTDIAKKVTELGGIHKNDLTHEVTHLVVGDYNTPKYRHVAYERPDIRPMCAGWVDAVLDLWTQDAPMDLSALEEAWTLKTFESHGGLPASGGGMGPDGLLVPAGASVERGRLLCSVTGFEEEDRQRVIRTIVDHGGVYSGDLTRAVTHLIVNKPEGKKYSAALQWGVRAVSIEWLRDCASRGMILDETKYDPRLPPAERGKGAWAVKTAAERAAVLGKRLRDAGGPGTSGAEKQGQRKLRKTASKKLSVQRDNLWGDILGKSTGGPGGSADSKESTPFDPPPVAEDFEQPRKRQSEPGTVNGGQPAKPIADASASSTKPPPPQPQQQPPQDAGGILSSAVFCIHGFPRPRADVLMNAVATMGGSVAISLDDMAGMAASRQTPGTRQHLIVPQDSPSSILPVISNDVSLVTEFFIEKCLHKKQYIDPTSTDAVIGRPFPVFPIPDFASFSICTSGFTGVDLNQIDKTVRQLGARYEERFTAQCSVLIVTALSAVRKQKLELALAWKVPVVPVKWLWACIENGAAVPIDSYLFPQLRQTPGSVSLRGGAVGGGSLQSNRADGRQQQQKQKQQQATDKNTAAAQAGGNQQPPRPQSPSPAEPENLTIPTLMVGSPNSLFVTQHPSTQDKSTGQYETAPTQPDDMDTTTKDAQDMPLLATHNIEPAQPTTLRQPAPQFETPKDNQPVSSPKQPQPQEPEADQPRPVPQLSHLQSKRKSLGRVLSEIADSNDGESDDPIESDEPATPRATPSANGITTAMDNTCISPAKNGVSRTAAGENTIVNRSASDVAAETGSAPAAATTANQQKKLPNKYRQPLSRIASEGGFFGQQPHTVAAHSTFGMPIGDLIKDGADDSANAGGGPVRTNKHLDSLVRAHSTGVGGHHASPFGSSIAGGGRSPFFEGEAPGRKDSTESPHLLPVAGVGAVDDVSNLPPTQVQVQYLDPEAEMYQEQLMRKILGTVPPERKSGGSSSKPADDGLAAETVAEASQPAIKQERPVRRSSRLR